MAYNNYNNTGPSNYEFLPFIKPRKFTADSKKVFSGYIEIELITVDKLFIGSGMSHFDGVNIPASTLQENGKLIIPGSSLKGAVRHISRAVSPSCIPDAKENEIRNGYFKKCRLDDCCIVCDMFGMMSKASKLRFTDLTSENGKTVKIKVPAQFEPKKNTDKYKEDRKFIGYKFYYTDCEERNAPKRESVEAIVENTSFTGKIFFNKLYKEELQLLMFALSFSEAFSIKLGKYKADGFGTVFMNYNKFLLNGTEEPLESLYNLAWDYQDMLIEKYPKQLEKLKKILSYKE